MYLRCSLMLENNLGQTENLDLAWCKVTDKTSFNIPDFNNNI